MFAKNSNFTDAKFKSSFEIVKNGAFLLIVEILDAIFDLSWSVSVVAQVFVHAKKERFPGNAHIICLLVLKFKFFLDVGFAGLTQH